VATEPETLAHDLTEAGLIKSALGYWLKASQRAIERSAYQEALSPLERALAFPSTKEPKRRLQANGQFAMTAPLCSTIRRHDAPVEDCDHPPDEAVANVRRHLWIEMVLLAALPAFAAAMARSYGQF
jgi:hypothetical protein